MKWGIFIVLVFAQFVSAQSPPSEGPVSFPKDRVADAVIYYVQTTCERGDERWKQEKYEIAELIWKNCFEQLAVERTKLRNVDQIKSLDSFITTKQAAIAQFRAELNEKRRIAAEELKKQQEKEREAARQAEIERLEKRRLDVERAEADKLAVLKAPPRRLRTGAVPIILKYFQNNLHNPASLQIVRWSKPVMEQGTKLNVFLTDATDPWYWFVTVRYRTRNAFNALVLTDTGFFIRNNEIVYITPLD